jgi:hypothetical protein
MASSARSGIFQSMNVAYQTEIEEAVPRYVQQLERIKKRSDDRAQMLVNDLGNLATVLVAVVQKVDDKYKDLGNTGREEKERLIDYKTTRIVGLVNQMADQYHAFYQFHANFISRTFREPMRLLQREIQRKSAVANEAAKQLNAIKDSIVAMTDNYQLQLQSFLNNSKLYSNLSNDQFKLIEDSRNAALERINALGEKTVRLYSASAGLADFVTDPQIWVIHAVKAARFGLLSLAVYLASSVFANHYADVVYTNKKPPPPLIALVGMIAAVDVALNAMLLLTLWMVHRITAKPGTLFGVLDETFFKRVIVDYTLMTVLLIVIGILMSEIIRRNPVFNYATDGVPSINTLTKVLSSVGGLLTLAPFFLMV